MPSRWVFAYGSLMWNPGFKFLFHAPAVTFGHHRSLCVLSYHYRGTSAKPGLVLGLDRGGECRGVAYEVAGEAWEATHAYLTARERISDAYEEQLLPVTLADGREAKALAYVMQRDHPQYAGAFTAEEVRQHIEQGHGLAGSCADYLRNTIAHLRALGIRDAYLEALVGRYPDLLQATSDNLGA
jgi:glutathione-specific gamma-glutamylcyclotransferase